MASPVVEHRLLKEAAQSNSERLKRIIRADVHQIKQGNISSHNKQRLLDVAGFSQEIKSRLNNIKEAKEAIYTPGCVHIQMLIS